MLRRSLVLARASRKGWLGRRSCSGGIENNFKGDISTNRVGSADTAPPRSEMRSASFFACLTLISALSSSGFVRRIVACPSSLFFRPSAKCMTNHSCAWNPSRLRITSSTSIPLISERPALPGSVPGKARPRDCDLVIVSGNWVVSRRFGLSASPIPLSTWVVQRTSPPSTRKTSGEKISDSPTATAAFWSHFPMPMWTEKSLGCPEISIENALFASTIPRRIPAFCA